VECTKGFRSAPRASARSSSVDKMCVNTCIAVAARSRVASPRGHRQRKNKNVSFSLCDDTECHSRSVSESASRCGPSKIGVALNVTSTCLRRRIGKDAQPSLRSGGAKTSTERRSCAPAPSAALQPDDQAQSRLQQQRRVRESMCPSYRVDSRRPIGGGDGLRTPAPVMTAASAASRPAAASVHQKCAAVLRASRKRLPQRPHSSGSPPRPGRVPTVDCASRSGVVAPLVMPVPRLALLTH
jgi:hypothetical protein